MKMMYLLLYINTTIQYFKYSFLIETFPFESGSNPPVQFRGCLGSGRELNPNFDCIIWIWAQLKQDGLDVYLETESSTLATFGKLNFVKFSDWPFKNTQWRSTIY